MNGAIVSLGIVLLVAGVFLVLYSVAYTQLVFGVTIITRVEYPYRDYGFVLLFVGALGLVLGLIMPKKAEP